MTKTSFMGTAGALTLALMATISTTAAKAAAKAADADDQARAGEITEVVVTAERRTQSVQKSSLAISVLSPDALKDAGVLQVRDLTKMEPGVQIGMGGPATQVYIRGVGDFGSTPITNPAVATNVDGVYVSRANSIEGNFFDLERIEVLKGPQGTLYGRNASGGALNIITAKPKLGVFTSRLEASVGNYEAIQVDASTNLPLGENLAVRAALQVVSREGFSSQGFDDDHHESFRLSALWKPSDAFSLRLTGDHTHVGGVGPGYLLKGPLDPSIQAAVTALGVSFPTDKRLAVSDPRVANLYYAVARANGFCIPNNAVPAASATKTGFVTPPTQGLCATGFSSLVQPPNINDARMNNRFNNVSAEANWELGFATLTVIPAYRRVRNDYTVFPVVGYDNGRPEKSDTYSLEARLGANTETLNWVAGVYYYRENQNVVQSPLNAYWEILGSLTYHQRYTTESKAVFGQATYSITDALRLIAGGRYSHDDRTIDSKTYAFDTLLPFPFAIGQTCYLKASPCLQTNLVGEKSFNSFTYKVGAEYDLTPQNMLFVTWATGQKAGGFSGYLALGNLAATYNPEKLGALEIGSRNRFMDSRLQVNLEGFYWRYRDSQQTFSTLDANSNPAFGITNAGTATMYGLDVDVTARLTPVDTLHLGMEYLKTKFDRFVFTSNGVTPANSACSITAGTPFQTIDCTGRPLTRAPKFAGSASYTHTFELASGASVDAALSGQMASMRWLGIDYIPAQKAKGYVMGDAVVTYHNADRNWSLSAYLRNFNNASAYTGSYTIGGVLPSLVVANLAAPRTYGVRIAADF